MQHIRLIYTKNRFGLVSYLVRWLLPLSRVKLAYSSHVMVVDGDYAIEATPVYGVRRLLLADALRGLTVVGVRDYPVADAEAGLIWLRTQVCTYEPSPPTWLPRWAQDVVALAQRVRHSNYDFKGVLGLGIAPDRDWQDESAWYCYEVAARTLLEAGLDVFADTGHMTEQTLLGIKHSACPL